VLTGVLLLLAIELVLGVVLLRRLGDIHRTLAELNPRHDEHRDDVAAVHRLAERIHERQKLGATPGIRAR
jgi:hypothetical protein